MNLLHESWNGKQFGQTTVGDSTDARWDQGERMNDDDVLQRTRELLERAAALQRELELFYQREAQQGHEPETVEQDPSGTAGPGEDKQSTD